MSFLAFLFLVWLLLAGVAYAVWMLRDAWKKGRSTTESSKRPGFSRLAPTKEIASQVIMGLGVCVVVCYALQAICWDNRFQAARDQTMSWAASWKPDGQSDEESNGRIPNTLFSHHPSRPDGPIVNANIGTAPITDEDLEWMTQEYPDLERVVLSRARLTDDGLRSLSQLDNLRTLSLARMRLTDAAMARVAALTNLRVLSLADCQISEVGITRLRSLRNLRQLSLDGTQVTDAGLASLASMTELEVLDPSHTPITEAGLRHLETLPKLRNVYLHGTAVPHQARARFCDR